MKQLGQFVHTGKVFLAKQVMKCLPSFPRKDDFATWEVFRLEEYTKGTARDQEAFKLKSAQYRYDYECDNPFFEKYFSIIHPDEYYQRSILDLGCFTGGRLVFWKERYQFGVAHGIDFNPIFAEAGRLFASQRSVRVDFATGFGEALPYRASVFDFIVSYDVFEHVRDVETVLQECWRVLKPGGRLLAVFPQFYHPLEAHLGSVTRMPALHWLFSGETLARAAYEIICERGRDGYWYTERPKLREWERLYSLNGITVRQFRRMVERGGWKTQYWRRDPILSDGRRSKLVLFRLLRIPLILPARLPLFEELFLGRICCVLQKPFEAD
jgi:SAM-dependent methyltransferase